MITQLTSSCVFNTKTFTHIHKLISNTTFYLIIFGKNYVISLTNPLRLKTNSHQKSKTYKYSYMLLIMVLTLCYLAILAYVEQFKIKRIPDLKTYCWFHYIQAACQQTLLLVVLTTLSHLSTCNLWHQATAVNVAPSREASPSQRLASFQTWTQTGGYLYISCLMKDMADHSLGVHHHVHALELLKNKEHSLTWLK